jgi:hypothetical protein
MATQFANFWLTLRVSQNPRPAWSPSSAAGPDVPSHGHGSGQAGAGLRGTEPRLHIFSGGVTVPGMRYAGMVKFPLAAAGLSRVACLCPFS